MTAIAVLATGVFVGLAVGAMGGHLPAFTLGVPRDNGRVEAALGAGNLGVNPGLFVAGCGGLALLTGTGAWQVSGIPALAVIPAGLAGAAPVVWLRRRAQRRRVAIRESWPDALAQISGNVRASRPLSHALVDVSLVGPPALREPMAGFGRRVQTLGVVPALQALADTVADPVTDRVVEVLCLAHSEGGRIVGEVVADLADSIAEEVLAAEEVDTLALEGRLNARLVFALPWVVLLLLTAQEGPFRAFYTSPTGTTVIAGGAVVSVVGVVLVSRLTRTPSEPRVLRGDDGRR